MNLEAVTSASPAPEQSIEAIEASVARPEKNIPRRLRRYLALDDFERTCKRRLPHMIYGYVSGAAETGSAMRGARDAFAQLSLVPRTLMNVSTRHQTTSLFGKSYSSPFGVAPLGGAAMVAYRADLALADAAGRTNVPAILSASSLIKLEDVARQNPDAWFQAYLAGDKARIAAMIDRVAAAGFQTLVVTADTPVPGNREHNERSGFGMPLRITPRVALDSALHPGWLLGTVAQTFLRHGVPHFENMDAHRGPPMMSQSFVRNMNSRDQLAWEHIDFIRDRWEGKLVVKGILSASDAKAAKAIGVDGVIVSNHGGRQLDYSVAPLLVLPEIVAEAGSLSVMLDGGIRRGTDVLKALALGADFVFLGRSFLYAAVVAGREGILHAMHLLSQEIDRDMALLGLRSLSEISSEMVRPIPFTARKEPAHQGE
ncbi:alpha-hydroxy acid oxidase [Nitratireductor sp. ZSWI3]|uniref:alpha-hydroxy acid oxidase n=1 Tax=Nitratireductor sp. ZSWI3 TaxID=2966359 RepID=UPI002150109C|nr:alpha-hydroxy acid oxidase [Nitratireductor sp. ZSWI3]MCR4265198.1 alpha-hydroxy-acid oxidizing protein [Nitratireductor sp. ZSWI3]